MSFTDDLKIAQAALQLASALNSLTRFAPLALERPENFSAGYFMAAVALMQPERNRYRYSAQLKLRAPVTSAAGTLGAPLALDHPARRFKFDNTPVQPDIDEDKSERCQYQQRGIIPEQHRQQCRHGL